MQLSDPIADMLTRLRNGLLARHLTVDVPHFEFKGAHCDHSEG